MNARPWLDPIPREQDAAMVLLQQRVPFNAARLAELADRAAPMPANHTPRPACDVLRILP